MRKTEKNRRDNMKGVDKMKVTIIENVYLCLGILSEKKFTKKFAFIKALIKILQKI
jgi:hypothetical protein